eukprot:61765-Pelagomonas_calceolata.AAC.3
MDSYSNNSNSALQNDFCSPSSPLCVAGAMSCLPRVHKAVEAARSHSIPVFWVIREHDPSGGMHTWKRLIMPPSVDIEYTRQHLVSKGGGAGATLPGSEGA